MTRERRAREGETSFRGSTRVHDMLQWKGYLPLKVEVIEVRGRGGQEDHPKQSCKNVYKCHGESYYFYAN